VAGVQAASHPAAAGDADGEAIALADDFLREGRSELAVAALRVLARSRSERTDLWMRLVALAQESGDAASLRATLDEALAARPDDAFLLLQRASLAWGEGRVPQALSAVRAAASAAPEWKEVQVLSVAWQVASRRWNSLSSRPAMESPWFRAVHVAARAALREEVPDASGFARGSEEERAAQTLRRWAEIEAASPVRAVADPLARLLRGQDSARSAAELTSTLHAVWPR
jgi:hypothetical protein